MNEVHRFGNPIFLENFLGTIRIHGIPSFEDMTTPSGLWTAVGRQSDWRTVEVDLRESWNCSMECSFTSEIAVEPFDSLP